MISNDFVTASDVLVEAELVEGKTESGLTWGCAPFRVQLPTGEHPKRSVYGYLWPNRCFSRPWEMGTDRKSLQLHLHYLPNEPEPL